MEHVDRHALALDDERDLLATFVDGAVDDGPLDAKAAVPEVRPVGDSLVGGAEELRGVAQVDEQDDERGRDGREAERDTCVHEPGSRRRNARARATVRSAYPASTTTVME